MACCQNCGKPDEVYLQSVVLSRSYGRWSPQNSLESNGAREARKGICPECSEAQAKSELLTTCMMLLFLAIALLYYFMQGVQVPY
jgi:hypothetical protein